MQHPSQLLSKDDIHLIRSYSLIAKGQGALTPAQLQLIYDRRWFKVLVPAYAGGLELSLPETMRLLKRQPGQTAALVGCLTWERVLTCLLLFCLLR